MGEDTEGFGEQWGKLIRMLLQSIHDWISLDIMIEVVGFGLYQPALEVIFAR
jgi:hypothetical protein